MTISAWMDLPPERTVSRFRTLFVLEFQKEFVLNDFHQSQRIQGCARCAEILQKCVVCQVVGRMCSIVFLLIH